MTMGETINNTLRSGEFHLMAKPVGPLCNLRCEYCFYLEKQAFFPKNEHYLMSDEVLRAYITKYIASQPTPDIEFTWQGGEPLLAGLDFFQKAIKLQKRHGAGRAIRNTLQTNGILLNDEWCRFLAENHFLVGLSLDGPSALHDRYRVDLGGRPTFDAVLHGLKLLQKHGVEYNVLACVNDRTSQYPLDVYRFFKSQGVAFIQFIPIVERVPNDRSRHLGLQLGTPPALDRPEHQEVTQWSVRPSDYADFIIQVFDEWVRNDVGRVFVMNFEWMLCGWIGGVIPACVYSPTCGRAIILEHNGDMYACDHFMYPEFKIGNILTDEPIHAIDSARQREFGRRKQSALPRTCRRCEFLSVCRGGCPKHRFKRTVSGECGHNYFCEGYKKIYRSVGKHLDAMRLLLERNLPASYILHMNY